MVSKNIRPAIEDDVAGIMNVQNHCFDQGFVKSDKEYLKLIDAGNCLVYQSGGIVVAVLMVDWKTRHIISFAVMHGFRGRGIGSALINTVLTALGPVEVTTSISNLWDNGKSVIQSCGFEFTGDIDDTDGYQMMKMIRKISVTKKAEVV